MKIGIVGGGFSGLILAVLLKKYSNNDVIIFEKNNKLGKKLLATGGGRCNIANMNIDSRFYNNQELYDLVIKNNIIDIKKFLFDEFDLLTINDNCLVYPYSYSSNTVLKVIINKLNEYNVKINLNTEITSILKINDNKYILNDTFLLDKIIFACGGKSYKNLGSDGSIFNILKDLGEDISTLRPSLVGFKAKSDILEGLRLKANVKLVVDNKIIKEEIGEVQFKKNGISGICVMNLSFYLPDNYKKAKLIIDPLYKFDDISFIKSYDGIFHEKLITYIKNKQIKDVKNIEFEILSLLSYDEAQVTRGGLNYLVSPKNKGLYFIGEMVNMDGICGGYNLMWGIYSAIYVLKSILYKNNI